MPDDIPASVMPFIQQADAAEKSGFYGAADRAKAATAALDAWKVAFQGPPPSATPANAIAASRPTCRRCSRRRPPRAPPRRPPKPPPASQRDLSLRGAPQGRRSNPGQACRPGLLRCARNDDCGAACRACARGAGAGLHAAAADPARRHDQLLRLRRIDLFRRLANLHHEGKSAALLRPAGGTCSARRGAAAARALDHQPAAGDDQLQQRSDRSGQAVPVEAAYRKASNRSASSISARDTASVPFVRSMRSAISQCC